MKEKQKIITERRKMLSLCSFRVRSPLKIVPSHIHQQPFPSTAYIHRLHKRKASSLTYPRICSSSRNASARIGGREDQSEEDVVGNVSCKGDVVLPEGLKGEMMPKHIAFFPDNNMLLGKQSGFGIYLGYLAAAQKLKQIVSIGYKWGIEVISVFAYSSEDWIRQQEKVVFGMHLLDQAINKYLEAFIRKGIRVSVIGDRRQLPDDLLAKVIEAQEATKNNSVLHIVVALDYNGHYDITQACKLLAGKVRDGVIEIDDIDDETVERELQTNCAKFPNPDLFIRTGGDLRTDNFTCWQLAYSELYFVEKFWLELEEEDLAEALRSYQNRDRRFGGRVSSTDTREN